MVSDTEISRIFQIPSRMIQKWKHSNDYKYLIYNYLKLTNKDEIDGFFNYLLTPNKFDSANLAPLHFIYKKDFMKKISTNMREILKLSANKKVGLDWSIDYISISDKYKKDLEESLPIKPLNEILNSTKTASTYSLFLVDDKKGVVYVELCNKVQEKDPLKKKINGIKKSLKDGYTLKHMLFITNEEDLPLYIRQMGYTFEGVGFWNAYMDNIAKRIFKAKKVIFVPNELKIPKLASKNSAILENLEKELTDKIIDIYEDFTDSYEDRKTYHFRDNAKLFCELIFDFSKNIKRDRNSIEIGELHTQLFLNDIRVKIQDLANSLLKSQSITSFEDDKKLDEMTANLHKRFVKHFLDMNALSVECWFENLDAIEKGFYEYLKHRKDEGSNESIFNDLFKGVLS